MPPSASRLPLSLPQVATSVVASGVTVVTAIARRSLVDLRVVVQSGSASDGEHPGASAVAASLVARALASDPTTAGFSIEAGVDRTVISGRVFPDELEPALARVSAALLSDKATLVDVRAAAARVEREHAAWLSSLGGVEEKLIRRDLFVARIGRHPYAAFSFTHDELSKIDRRAVEEHMKSAYVAENVAVVAVGPLDGVDVAAMVERNFDHLPLSHGRAIEIDEPAPRPRPLHIVLVDRKGQREATVTVGRLAAHAGEEGATAARLAGELVRTRMRRSFGDVELGFRLEELRDAPGLALFDASGVTPERAAALVSALVARELSSAPDAAETARARGAFDDRLGASFDTPGILADMLAGFAALEMPPSTLEREEVEASTAAPPAVAAGAGHVAAGDAVAVVVGDASLFGAPLSEVGEVDVLDPRRDLERARTIPAAPSAKLPIGSKTGDDRAEEPPRR